MAKRPAIANEDEYRGWRDILDVLEDVVILHEADVNTFAKKDFAWSRIYRARLSAATKARDALLGPIRAYQEGRVDSDTKRDTVDRP